MAEKSSCGKTDPSPQGLKLLAQGRVQGVGFRPFVYRLARELELTGSVQNTHQGVEIWLYGPGEVLQRFERRLLEELPPLAEITSLQKEAVDCRQEPLDFRILQSREGESHRVLISPDIAACPDCLAEIFHPGDRRHQYPFTNCTNCGPRYTITRDIPYDRRSTSMACFPMCPDCREEYHNPLDRRFHAQPNACPRCGPHVWLADSHGRLLSKREEALRQTARDLSLGYIAAIKGLGGFHLACPADNAKSIALLRTRKNRPDKPLAIMAPDLAEIERFCRIDPEAEKWLTGAVKPIVLLPRKSWNLPEELSPDTGDLGVMLPYTPLHSLLMQAYQRELGRDRICALVLTSGNRSEEPIALGNREAARSLSGIADRFVFHNRDILLRCDDSVLRPLSGDRPPLNYRRARGFTPDPLSLGRSGPSILALGADNKSTICLTKGSRAFVSQHIGDLQNPETLSFYEEIISHTQTILKTEPQVLAADLHPEYASTRHSREYPRLPLIRVQHHAAHVLSVAAENEHFSSCLGLALDGTGLGEDGTLWGGELLEADFGRGDIRRLAHFSPMPLPGGEQAIREPWRTTLGYLLSLDLEPRPGSLPWLPERQKAHDMAAQMVRKGLNSPTSTSCGRLFDAVSALLGLVQEISYEGQAAVRLEAIQKSGDHGAYPCRVLTDRDPAHLDTGQLFSRVYSDWQSGEDPGVISSRFHRGLCLGLAELVRHFSEQSRLSSVALSGGVMQNQTISTLLPNELAKLGIRPLLHTSLPANDACISLGQAVYARHFA